MQEKWKLTELEHEELWYMLSDFWHTIAARRDVDCEVQDMPAGGAFDCSGFQLIRAFETVLDVSMNGYEDEEDD